VRPAFELGARKEGYDYHVYSVGPDTEFIVKLLQREKPSVIVNFSAQGEGQASFESAHWKYFYRTNTQALVELTEKLHGEKWLHRFIQVGTSELYGSVTDPATEDAPLRPSSPYAISKAAFDLHLVSIAKTAAFPAVIVRPSNAYCPGQQLHRVIPRAFIFGKTGRRLPLHGGGRAEKSYIHADDLSRAIALLSEEGKVGEVYNCGPDDPISIRHLLQFCAMTLQMKFEELVEEAPERQGQDGRYWLDSSKLKALGWAPPIPLGLGLRNVLDWIEAYPDLWQMDTDYRLRA
jgi:dTDP-glucose 4,6-dehydratase